jgi:hypothetical protein
LSPGWRTGACRPAASTSRRSAQLWSSALVAAVAATFNHDKLFRLDSDHNARCITCHEGSDYRRYTCYGCHEHTPDNIRREHVEEGIRDYSNCVKCHRSADEDDIRGEGGGKRDDD